LSKTISPETDPSNRPQVHNGEGGDHEGETYILLVDDDDNAGAHLESLNSQTLYIDSTSLANGDLSNVVLMTGPPPTSAVSGDQVICWTSSSSMYPKIGFAHLERLGHCSWAPHHGS
jgi:hypothetical protein